MNTAQKNRLRKMLVRRDGDLCHYCDMHMIVVGKQVGAIPSNYATLEHVVPRSAGGRNSLDNLVLACPECNNARADRLDFCSCDFCVKAHTDFFDKKFWSLVNANKVRVYWHAGKWRANKGGQHFTFSRWSDAIHFATSVESYLSREP